MARLIDICCTNCEYRSYDVWAEPGEYPACPTCGAQTERLWTSTATAIGDDIPGGLLIENGLCWADGSPRRFDTKSSILKEAKKRNLHWGAFLGNSPRGRRWV